MKKKSLFNIILIFLIVSSCYLLLVAGNVLIKRAYNNNIKGNISEALEIERLRYINQDKKEIEIAKKEGYVPILPPVFFDYGKRMTYLQNLVISYKYIPLGAQPNEKIYYCNEGYGLIKYKSDRYGFRNPDKLWDINKEIDNILIGDSFVNGSCVEDEYTFRGQIAKSFPLTINLGMSGSFPKVYSRQAEFFIKKIQPKNVITFFFANDNEGEYKTIFDKDFMKNSNNLLVNNRSQLEEFYRKGNERAKLYVDSYGDAEVPKENLWNRLKDDFQLDFYKQIIFNTPGKSTKETIDVVVNMCKIYSCNPYFIFLPTSDFWRPDYRQDDYRAKIKTYIENKHSLYSNFFDAMEIIKNNDNMFAPEGPHYSKKGYKLISSEIIKLIEN